MSWKFAHLFGGPNAKAEDDEEEKKARRAEEDEDQEEQAEEDQDPPKSKKAKKAEDEGDSPKDEDEGDPEADDDSDDKGDVKKARAAENKRCAAIFASSYAAKNTALAAHLAFETRVSASEAIHTMKLAGSAPAKSRLDQRMAALPAHQLGQDAPAKGAGAAAMMIDVYNRAQKGK